MLSKKAHTVTLPAVDMSGEVSLEASDCGSGDLVKSGGVWVSTIVTAKGQRLRRLHDEICSTRRRKIGTGGVHVERADAEANRFLFLPRRSRAAARSAATTGRLEELLAHSELASRWPVTWVT